MVTLTTNASALPVYIVDNNGLTVDDPSNTSGSAVVGNVNSGATDAGAPVKIGGVAVAAGAVQTAVTPGARVNSAFGVNGEQLNRTVAPVNLATGQVSVALTATQIVPARPGRAKVTITLTAANQLYLGGAAVTAANGVFIAPTVGASITIETQAAVFAIATTTATVVSFFETY